MLNDSLSQGSLICLSYAYFFSTSEPEYAYKRYAYKKKHVIIFKLDFLMFSPEVFSMTIYVK